jgi:putative tryptophan/tyrosine transport system substrate-binding protein
MDGVAQQIAPEITRVAVLRDATVASGSGQFGAVQAMAPSLGIEVSPIGLSDPGEIERVVTEFARGSNRGLIATAGGVGIRHRHLIISLAARHRLPAVYANKFFVTDGGLMSFATHLIEQFRQAAGYVDRVLKGEKPANLPMQAPTRFELVIKLQTAKAVGLSVPPSLPARADEVIE